MKKHALADDNFRHLVVTCASDPEVVALFNAHHGTDLSCPIHALVDPVFPLEMEDHEALNLAYFVAWVQINKWERIKRSAARLTKLKRIYKEREGRGRLKAARTCAG